MDDLYDREPTGVRVVELTPGETWTTEPIVFEEDE